MPQDRNRSPTPPSSITKCFTELEDSELIRLRAALDVEMRKRKIARTVGQMAEQLAIDYFNSVPGCPNLISLAAGTANVDAISRKGERYSFKGICSAKKTGTIYPDPDNPNKQLFEYILVIKLLSDWSLDCIYEFDWVNFVTYRSWDKRMNAWYLSASKKKLSNAKKYDPV